MVMAQALAGSLSHSLPHAQHILTTPQRSQHTWVSTSLCQTTLFPFPNGQQAIHTLRTTTITQNIVPLTFPNKQTFGSLLDHAKPNGCICLTFCNIARFPLDIHNNSKVQDLQAFQTQFQVDIFGDCKSNLNWKKIHQLDHTTFSPSCSNSTRMLPTLPLTFCLLALN